jgi:hypothetical protein
METDILIKAGNKFELATGIKFSIIKRSADFSDASIMLKWNNNDWVFDVEVKTTLNAAVVGQFKQDSDRFNNTPVLFTSYVTPAFADQLRASHVNFIDTAGNAYISEPPLFITIKGNKPDDLPGIAKRLYRSSGLKIIFTLLCNPNLEKEDYRTIASMADVALGSVGWVMRDLKQSGYLINLGRIARILNKKEELLKNWVSHYQEQLKPKIFIGRYAALDEGWWKKVSMQESTLWGSEFAAKILTKYLKPANYSIYMKKFNPEFLMKNRLHSTPEGNIEIFNKFWSFNDQWTNQNIVPP